MNGYEKLKESVTRDCAEGCNCFNPEGCDGYPGQRKDGRACFHKYCDKFRWVIDRAKHYAEKTGLNWEDILTAWEEQRDYWYMNYYQDCNQPEIKSDRVKVFESAEEMLKAIGERKFRCPMCGGISTNPYKCNSGLKMSNGKICDWTVNGLFGDLGKGTFVYCKKELRGENIFMPIGWEVAK